MQLSQLTWPNTAAALQASAETVSASLNSEITAAASKLGAIESDAAYTRHPLSTQAEALAGLRSELNAMRVRGNIITASPYSFQVGSKQATGSYLNPQTALKTLAEKLRDSVDKNRPTGELNAIVVLVSAAQISSFAQNLTSLTAVLPIPDWCQVAKQATALSTNAVDKLYQPAAIVQPRFKPQSNLNTNPMRDYLTQQGSQLATLESLAHDKTNVISKLQALAAKRSAKLTELNAALSALKNISGSVYSLALSGSAESIATQLSQAKVPNNHQHTVASVFLSNSPLTFFKELLC